MVIARSTSVEFKSGMLLSKEMLDQLEYQTHITEIQYHLYPDGIIYGLEIVEKQGRPFFSPGLVKFKGKYYYSPAYIDLWCLLNKIDEDREKNSSNVAFVLVPCDSENIHKGVISECLDLILVNQCDMTNDMICLAEVQYYYKKREWRCPSQKADEALSDQLNTTGFSYSFLNVRYSLPNETVFSPYVYGIMRDCLEQINDPSLEDVSLLFILSQNRLISFEVFKQWFRCKGIEVDFGERKQIIEKFLEGIQMRRSSIATPSNEPSLPKSEDPKLHDEFGI